MIFKLFFNIEICETRPEDKLAGRLKIKMSALKISKDDNDNNANGINWKEEYVLNNLDSFIGAPYKVCFIDDEKTIPSGHGTEQYDENGEVIFPDSDTVGTIMDAKIEEVVINEEIQKVLVTYGYLFYQSYPNFCEWLKSEMNRSTVYGSVEINGNGDNKKIFYDNNATPQTIGRKPRIFDFTALAILSDLVEPADKSSIVFEINSKTNGGDEKNMSKKITINNDKDSAIMDDKWDIDKGEYFRNCKEASNASAVFKEAYLEVDMPDNIEDITEADCKYPHHTFKDDTLVVNKAGCQAAASRGAANGLSSKGKTHLRKHYRELGLEIPEFLGGKSIENNSKVKISKTVEINELSYDDLATLITRTFNIVVGSEYFYDYWIYKLYPQSNRVVMMKFVNDVPIFYMATYTLQDNKVTLDGITEVEEDWRPIGDEAAAEINIDSINKKLKEEGRVASEKNEAELNQIIKEKDERIATLEEKNKEISELLVNANKLVEEYKTNFESISVELNTCKEELQKYKDKEAEAEANAKKDEILAYFNNEISKNGFSDEEINSLKQYVENVDLDGLKMAEAELCAKKYKEIASARIETNSKTTAFSFIPIVEKSKKDIPNIEKIPSFFSD